ncbi:hypothetical protein SPBR_04687 [Sporothrix brasiliensis 5110]|uniref:Zn(2)-C6 fungal-type domain-containing protein n=1 Tax=Sporothrix brasiliensis 5110 TaxID=1398154 RepID=A0A0C2IR11_9PEZI|nr:uncharacterized protein SPBR_04687 [Sporothrix brasiliensis 5110]KIH87472.1 hypothetical protein SPBR_04687 [Sporothrix brasiliensis 5110]
MAGLAGDQGSKRKRVFRACDSCRAMKSKCDGARPACGRCTGYGYKCLYGYAGKRNQRHRIDEVSAESASASLPLPLSHDDESHNNAIAALQLTARDYSSLVRAVVQRLPEPEQPSVLDVLEKLDERVVHEAQIRAPARPSLGHASASKAPNTAAPTRNASSTTAARSVERYLGEVSDVRFFNLVDRALAGPRNRSSQVSGHLAAVIHDVATSTGANDDDALQSYEQDGAATNEDTMVEFPDADAAGRYLDIYFSTIHVAYPFLPRALFMKTYERYVGQDPNSAAADISDTWLATMYTLFAIGACYEKAASGSEDARHEQYYRHALALSSGVHRSSGASMHPDTLERSLHQVSFLLAQCFYLLAVCRTDKCWTTLGLAVRIAQSIGLHVDAGCLPHGTHGQGQRRDGDAVSAAAFHNAELRRRVWYSVYVLDRLLALQLGRPPAIHDEDCHLLLPSRLGDGDIDWLGTTSEQQPPDAGVPTVGDYFVHMIALSKIIGYVLRDLYSPRGLNGLRGDTGDTSLDKDDTLTGWLLPTTKRLDRQLLEWRRALPRKLRFDFGHAFDTAEASPATSAIFRRQRNMLAIKFHHLRAVIHRPYLCLPLLHGQGQGHGASTITSPIARRYETVCILEARATAQLLHHVVDKQNLVHDFPWWQMISCLVYASSILVVASAFARRNTAGEGNSQIDSSDGDGNDNLGIDGTSTPVDADALDAAALEDDAETCLTVFEALSPNSESARLARDMMRRLKARGAAWRWRDMHGRDTPGDTAAEATNTAPPPSQAPDASVPAPMETDDPTTWQEWPLEILDSMEWSTQLFHTIDGLP